MLLQTICIFCGSSVGANPAFREAAREFGTFIGNTSRKLVFGGGHIGLIGVLADAALAAGAPVTGVIPRKLVEKELAHRGLTELRVVESMHQRKALMAELADSFVALPGGVGTLEEFFEVWTWSQLGLHHKPFGILNVQGFFDPLLRFLEHVVAEKLLKPENLKSLAVDSTPAALVEKMLQAKPADTPKWIDRKET